METEIFYQLHLRTLKKFTHNDSNHLSRSSPGFQRLAAAALVVMGAAFASAARVASRSMLTYLDRVQNDAQFIGFEVLNDPMIGTFESYTEDALSLVEVFGILCAEIIEEAVNDAEPDVTGGGSVASFGLEVVKESRDRGSTQIRQRQSWGPIHRSPGSYHNSVRSRKSLIHNIARVARVRGFKHEHFGR